MKTDWTTFTLWNLYKFIWNIIQQSVTASTKLTPCVIYVIMKAFHRTVWQSVVAVVFCILNWIMSTYPKNHTVWCENVICPLETSQSVALFLLTFSVVLSSNKINTYAARVYMMCLHCREDWKPVLTINSVVYGLQYLFLVSMCLCCMVISIIYYTNVQEITLISSHFCCHLHLSTNFISINLFLHICKSVFVGYSTGLTVPYLSSSGHHGP